MYSRLMKNVINEKPNTELHGRLRASMAFVRPEDIKGKRLLDIGCGYGWFELNALAAGVDSIVGLDLTDQDLETARREVKDPRAKFVASSALDLPFPDGSFDTVVAWEVIEHIPKGTEMRFFQEIKRVLRAGGRLYISTPNSTFFSNIMDPAWWLIGHRHYRVKDLRMMAIACGYGADVSSVIGRWWTILQTLNLYVAKWVFFRGPFFKTFFDAKDDLDHSGKGFVGIFMRFNRT